MERTLYDWVGEAVEALGLPPEARWVDDKAVVEAVLELARDVAQGVARPAAPIGAFLAGVAVGLDPAKRIEDVREELARTL